MKINKNKEDIAKLTQEVKIKETTGNFIAPTNGGKVEITGWSMPVNNTVIAVLFKVNPSLTGLAKASVYNPKHNKMFANTRGNAVGTVIERTVNVKFVYIDHTDDQNSNTNILA